MSHALVIRPGDDRETISGAGDEYRFLATGQETNGRYFLMEGIVPPGGGPPPHIQTREEEGFYILEGTVRFWVDGEVIDASVGTFLHVPRGMLHSFRNESNETARVLFFFAPSGIEEMFSRMGVTPELYAEIANEYGVEFPKELGTADRPRN